MFYIFASAYLESQTIEENFSQLQKESIISKTFWNFLVIL